MKPVRRGARLPLAGAPRVHEQPGGEVIATAVLHDGRVLRVCGGRPGRGCAPCAELHKWITWLERRGQR